MIFHAFTLFHELTPRSLTSFNSFQCFLNWKRFFNDLQLIRRDCCTFHPLIHKYFTRQLNTRTCPTSGEIIAVSKSSFFRFWFDISFKVMTYSFVSFFIFRDAKTDELRLDTKPGGERWVRLVKMISSTRPHIFVKAEKVCWYSVEWQTQNDKQLRADSCESNRIFQTRHNWPWLPLYTIQKGVWAFRMTTISCDFRCRAWNATEWSGIICHLWVDMSWGLYQCQSKMSNCSVWRPMVPTARTWVHSTIHFRAKGHCGVVQS